MRSILAAAHTVEHYVRIVAVGGDLRAKTTGAGHFTGVVARDRTRGRLGHDFLFYTDRTQH